ncbi:MAG: hypothetical protein M1818_008331 [Claussenomyces sp. TS43310]|nr:MAG: hypothetical protein M1818_008331 [Claussenomyces sp. TS43310]
MPHYEPSRMSTNSKLATYAKRITQGQSQLSDVLIRLDEHNDSPHTYTTLSPLSGQVSITPPHDARFDEIQITLEGRTRVEVEPSATAVNHARVQASHRFLKLTMPISESVYPQPRIAEAGRTYTFPFNFVIPERLLPSSCMHSCVARHVHETHLRLPPSTGHAETASLFDLAPEMGKILYSIDVKVIRYRERDGRASVLTSASRAIRIMPSVVDEPPLHIQSTDTEYAMVRTKDLKKGMFKGKLGSITLSSTQPKSFIVSPATTSSPPTTTAILNLRFDPSNPSYRPPRLSSVVTRIKALTFCCIQAQTDLARRIDMMSAYDPSRSMYTSTQTLSNLKLDSSDAWVFKPHFPPQYSRRDSGYETAVEAPAGSGTSGTGYYEAQICVPLSLPQSKLTWLPTFHSCLLSRIYSLEIALSVSTGSSSTGLRLRMPVQISCSSVQRRGSAVHVATPISVPMPPNTIPREIFHGHAASEVEMLTTPRVIQFSNESSLRHPLSRAPARHRDDAPPGYEAFVA